jgi:hypothetical protein
MGQVLSQLFPYIYVGLINNFEMCFVPVQYHHHKLPIRLQLKIILVFDVSGRSLSIKYIKRIR